MRIVYGCGAALAAACLLASAATAQSAQRFSVQVSGLFASLHAGDYDRLDVSNGYGGEAQVRFTPGRFSLGAGFQFTQHNMPAETWTLSDGSQSRLAPWNVRLFGFFVEPRLVIPLSTSAFAPYVSGRFSLLRYEDATTWRNTSGIAGTMNVSTHGLTLNGGGGLLVRLTQRVNLDLGATYGYSNFDKYRITTSSSGLSVTDVIAAGSGSNIVVRAGLAVGIGG